MINRIINKIRRLKKDWQYSKMPNTEFLHTLKNGLKMDLDKRNYGDYFYYSEESNLDLIKFIKSYIKESNWVFDIGAQKGYVTLNLAKAVGSQGRVFSFEPDKRSFENLNKNIKSNNFKNCSLFNLALGDKVGTVKFNLTKTLGWSSMFPNETAMKDTKEVVEVPLNYLDGMIEKREIVLEKVDFVKIDCEGAELLVLKGMVGMLKKFKPILWMEINKGSLEASSTKLSDIYMILSNNKYEIYLPIIKRRFFFLKYLSFIKIDNLNDYVNNCYDIVAIPREIKQSFLEKYE